MASKALPAQAALTQLLSYSPETGKLFWKERPASFFRDGAQSSRWNANIWNSKNAGKEAFVTSLPSGHLYASINRVKYLAHRVVWKLVHGDDPNIVDHINGDPADNRICNLRTVTQVENGRNHRRRKNNKSGVMGVAWDKRRQRWSARIHIRYSNHFLGYFDTFEQAVVARRAAEIQHGFHPNHGRTSAT